MDKGIYTALSGGIAKAHELELVSNNLANANTPGFKGDTGTFNEYLSELRKPDTVEGLKREITADTMLNGRPVGDKSFVEMDGVYTNFKQGPINQTGRSLDVALDGGGFFEVLAPTGVRYTRQGNFNVNNEGKLVTINGYPVLGKVHEPPKDEGLVRLTTEGKLLSRDLATVQPDANAASPEAREIRLAPGPVTIGVDGSIYQNGRQVGSLSIQEFKEPQHLEKVGNSYFRNTHPDNLKSGVPTTQAHQGALEGANVNPVKEMTRLIEVTRAYESHMQAIKTYQEMDGRTVNEIARER